MNRLKERARRSRRSLQHEVKDILERATTTLTGRMFFDSTQLIREDRDGR
jgi:hypothetical protein